MLIGMKTKRIVSSELFEYVSVWMGAVESGWVINTNRLEVSFADTRARPNTGMVLMEVELLTGSSGGQHGDQVSTTE